MKQSQKISKTISQTLRARLNLLPVAGAAILLASATPVLADHKHGARGGDHKQQPAAKVRQLERKVNRTVRRLSRELDALQPVSHRHHKRDRDRRYRHDRYRDHRYDRNRGYQRDRRHAGYRGGDRFGHHYFRHDARYQPMSFRQWKRYQWRMTHDERYVTERGYRRYLKKYRKHYTHGHKPRRYAHVDHGRGHDRRRRW